MTLLNIATPNMTCTAFLARLPASLEAIRQAGDNPFPATLTGPQYPVDDIAVALAQANLCCAGADLTALLSPLELSAQAREEIAAAVRALVNAEMLTVAAAAGLLEMSTRSDRAVPTLIQVQPPSTSILRYVKSVHPIDPGAIQRWLPWTDVALANFHNKLLQHVPPSAREAVCRSVNMLILAELTSKMAAVGLARCDGLDVPNAALRPAVDTSNKKGNLQ